MSNQTVCRRLLITGLVVLGGAAAFVAVIALLLFLLLAFSGMHLLFSHLDALKAAGLGGSGSAIQGLGAFIDHIKGNLTWLVLTGAGLIVLVIGAMFLIGHSRATDYAVKAGVGFAIIAGGTGIVL